MYRKAGGKRGMWPRENLDDKAPSVLSTYPSSRSPDHFLESNRSALGNLQLAETSQQTGQVVDSTLYSVAQQYDIAALSHKRTAGTALSNSVTPSLKRRSSGQLNLGPSRNTPSKSLRQPNPSTHPDRLRMDLETRTGKDEDPPQSRTVGRSAAKERLRREIRQTAASPQAIRASTKHDPAISAIKSMQRRLSAASSEDESLSARPQTKGASKIDTQLISINDLKTEIQTLYANTFGLEEQVRRALGAHKSFLAAKKTPDSSSSTETTTSSKASTGTTEYDGQSQIIFALHRNLIQEYYDLFRATQYASAHPNAPKEVKNFCHTHQLPSRLWKNGVHNLLEFWRTRLPESKEYLHAYIYLAYQMFTLLFETVKAFENSWLECLGDLSRYRMAIEQENAKERDLWLEIADMWYAKASVPQPNLGRLLHHRAIIARRHGIWQMLHFYARSLSAIEPFTVARSSLEMTVFKPNSTAQILSSSKPHTDSKDSLKAVTNRLTSAFVRLLALNFDKDANVDGVYDTALNLYKDTLPTYVSLAGASYQFIGETMCVACITAVTGFGIMEPAQSNGIRRLFDAAQQQQTTKVPGTAAKEGFESAASTKKFILGSWWLLFRYTLQPLLSQLGDESVLPSVHTALVFIYSLSSIGGGIYYFLDDANIPWPELATFLNSWATIRQLNILSSRFTSSEFPHASRCVVQGNIVDTAETPAPSRVPVNRNVLPEDRSMQGQSWARDYLPKDFFAAAPSPDEEPPSARDTFDPAQGNIRIERCIWLSMRIIEAVKAATAGWQRRGRWLGVKHALDGPIFTAVSLDTASQLQQQTHESLQPDVALIGADVIMSLQP